MLLAALAVAAFAYFYPIRRRTDYLATAAVATLPVAGPVANGLATVSLATSPPPPPPTAPPASPTTAPDASPSPVATITPLSTIVGIVLEPSPPPPGASPSPAPNLVQNGDFSADWVIGWERTTEGVNGVQVVETRLLSGDPPQPSLFMSKTGAGALRISQHIALSGAAADLVFRAQLRLAAEPASPAGEGRSALILFYEDADGQPLGASVWLDGSAAASGLWGDTLPPFGPTTAPRIQAPDWQTVEIALGREFTDRLPDLDPDAVRRVTVVLALVGSAGCPPDGCGAELSATALSLTPVEPLP